MYIKKRKLVLTNNYVNQINICYVSEDYYLHENKQFLSLDNLA